MDFRAWIFIGLKPYTPNLDFLAFLFSKLFAL